MVSNITKRSKSGGIDKVSKWRSPGRNIGVRVSELTGLDMVVTGPQQVRQVRQQAQKVRQQASDPAEVLLALQPSAFLFVQADVLRKQLRSDL